jgi:SAM-dependent methyltransferase
MDREFDQDYTDYQANRSLLRKWVRRAYLRSAASQVSGPTLDFGCGVGELLERLPAGSRGLEYNQATVEFCRRKGLPVDAYDGFADDWDLSALAPRSRFDSMVVSHVLEHLEEPAQVLRRLLLASQRLGVRRVLAIVPGRAGFRIDATHRTFVDRDLLTHAAILRDTGFSVQRARYFPGNLRRIGDWVPHHELQVLYIRP